MTVGAPDRTATRALSARRIASAPCSFGVDEVVADDAWVPGPDEMLDWMLGIGYRGTELGAPGYLGTGREARVRLERRGLALVGAFLPQHFSRADRAAADREWLREQVTRLRDASPEGSRPFAVLCEAIDEPDRLRWSGRIADHPQTRLDAARHRTLVDNLHRAAELVASLGLPAVIHPHAGTYIETDHEIERLMEVLDPSLVGLCLDTGHFRYGGADPVRRIRDYAGAVRHVHIKDCRASVLGTLPDGAGFVGAVKAGVFCPLGEGDSDIPGSMAALAAIGYEGWLVVEQDTALTLDITRAQLVATQRGN
ncbi:MAG: TIM barrel protein, partial [Candidatus Limnocylindrales bacterium]